MKRKVIAIMLSVALVSTMTGCKDTKVTVNVDANQEGNEDDSLDATSELADTTKGETDVEDEVDNKESKAQASIDTSEVQFLERPSLVGNKMDTGVEEVTPKVPKYSVNADFSNVINPEEVDGYTDEYREKLAKNLFVVGDEDGKEFWNTYEYNAYGQTPNFVTVDSMMHTYHLYFSHLLKKTEQTYLTDTLKKLSADMYEESLNQYEELKGSEWEKSAVRNVEYFAIASSLIGNKVDVPSYAKKVVDEEISKITKAEGVDDSAIVGVAEDYSQYKPRGYYAGNKDLENYFRTMMWYGRINFRSDDDSELRSAALITMGLNKAGKKDWEAIYAVTSFFAGASDDMGYCEYLPIMEVAYGELPDTKALLSDSEGWDKVAAYVAELDAPKIQSIPVFDDEENVIPGFRFMGQRFTIDASIMQNLMYRSVEANENDDKRMLPSALDVPAALGSEIAKEIVLEEGANKFPNYIDRLTEQRKDIVNAPDTMWSASLYAQWLDTLRPLLIEKGEGYPAFMQSDEWTKKTIETFVGSYAELKHDTVLYAKQPVAEMGGGDLDEVDDRGYVEPEPKVFTKFANLAMATSDGLKSFDMIDKEDIENLDRLSELASRLATISCKELNNELCTDEEYELIRNYGGNIEHFWYEAYKSESDDGYFTTDEYPAAIIVDVATDPNGTVLEIGTGNPREIAVVVPVDGKLRIAVGSVYNYYEFEWPMSDRLTDDEWRLKIGAMINDNYEYERDDSFTNPEWTQSYRAVKWDRSAWW